MLKKIIKIILFILLVVIICFILAFVDYKRINNNSKPIFSIQKIDSNNNIVIYQGLFHKIVIKYSMSVNEKISDAKDIKYYLFNSKNIKLNKNILNTKNYYYLKYQKEDYCSPSKLLYYNKDYKLYSYCIVDGSLMVENYKSGEKDVLLSEFLKKHSFKDAIQSFYYHGFAVDTVSLEYINKGSESKLKLIECKLNGNTDYYIGPEDMEYQIDFCLPKDDVKGS